jgi:hypothetical protein
MGLFLPQNWGPGGGSPESHESNPIAISLLNRFHQEFSNLN